MGPVSLPLCLIENCDVWDYSSHDGKLVKARK